MVFFRSWFTWYYSGHHELYEILQIYHNMCGSKMRDFEVKNAKKFWGGLSPPQTPPNNEEGTPPPQTPPLNVGKVPTFCHSSPTRESWIRP